MRALGWTVTGVVAGLAASAAVAVIAADRDARDRLAASARQVRERVEETGERWTHSTEEFRGRVAEGADQWREQRREEVGRALLSAAEARDASLEDDDLDEGGDGADRDG